MLFATNSRPENGFNPGNPVDRVFPHPIPRTAERDFFDRTRALALAQAVLSETTRKPLLVRGERCIGKTSLLNRIRRWLETPPQRDRYRAVPIEPGSLTAWHEFAQELWDAAQAAIDGAATLPAEYRTPRELRSFTQFLGELRRLLAYLPGVTFVVFLDELDKIKNHADALEQTKILSLIRFLVEAEDLPLAFVISVLREIPGQDGLGSPLAVEEIALEPFEPEDAAELARSLLSPMTLSPEAAAWVDGKTAGHPYFVKLLLAMICDAHAPAAVALSRAQVEAAVRSASHARSKQLGDVLRSIYRSYLIDGEREVLLRLAAAPGGRIAPEELRAAPGRVRAAAAELALRGYVTLADDGSCALRLGWFGDWLLSWHETQSETERLAAPLPVVAASPQPDVLIDVAKQTVWLCGRPKTGLSALEFSALVCLAEHVDEVVTKDALCQSIYPEEDWSATNWTLSSLIYRIRQELGDDGKAPKYVETVRSVGYRIRNAGFTK